MPVFAAVDIGSNSVRLSIAELRSGRLVPLHQDREVTRLGESVFRQGVLEPQAMAHTIKVLRRFHRATQSFGADYIRVVATSAARDAGNSKVFAGLVRSATGWNVEIISGLEEGRLVHLGVVANTRTTASRLLLIDLGGGSCEVTISNRGHIQTMVSLPLGAVRLTEEFLRHDPPKRKEMDRLQRFIEEEFSRVQRQVATARVKMVIATSGTAAALLGAAEATQKKSHRHSQVVSTRAVTRLAELLARMNVQQRLALPGINAKRAEIIVAGAAVYATLLTRCGLKGFRFSPLGLRDGLLHQMAADHDRSTRSGRQIESMRQDALRAMAAHYKVDLEAAQHVGHLAGELFQSLKPVHRLPSAFADYLAAAAMLHEVGMYVNRAGRFRHAHYLIAHSEIFGYTAFQRALIAAIARYQGNTRPVSSDRIMKRITPPTREEVAKAVVLLRLARALDYGNRRAVSGLKARIRDAQVTLRLETARGGADLEAWAVEKEMDYFREVFGRELALADS